MLILEAAKVRKIYLQAKPRSSKYPISEWVCRYDQPLQVILTQENAKQRLAWLVKNKENDS